jgi:hypothetical protein
MDAAPKRTLPPNDNAEIERIRSWVAAILPTREQLDAVLTDESEMPLVLDADWRRPTCS